MKNYIYEQGESDSDLKADVGSVVEGVEIRVESLGSLKSWADVQRVSLALLHETALALLKRGAEKGIAIGGQHNLPRTKVEGDNGHMLTWYMKAINDAVGLVLLQHGLQHGGYDDRAGRVVAQQLVDALACGQLALGFVSSHSSQHGLGGFGILVEGGLLWLTMLIERGGQALTVAYHPDFAADAAEDDGRAGETVLGMRSETRQHGASVVLADVAGNSRQELLARGGLWHVANIATHQLHGIAAIGAQDTVAVVGLGGAAIDNGYEISGYDDSVLAFLCGILGNDCLLDNLHVAMMVWRALRVWHEGWDTAAE